MVAGTLNKAGYVQICIKQKVYYGHRLAWFYSHNEWPEQEIDHKDHNKSNNRFDNLRKSSHSSNGKNQTLNKRNKTGTPGVIWDRFRSKWSAYITVNYKRIGLGRFDTKEEAIEARKKAERKYRFHPNHGKAT
jgi:hypothetical protein